VAAWRVWGMGGAHVDEATAEDGSRRGAARSDRCVLSRNQGGVKEAGQLLKQARCCVRACSAVRTALLLAADLEVSDSRGHSRAVP
jgi:hypothetical protein